MADESAEDKTEEPTGKRITESREKGQVLKSREVAHVVVLGAATLIIMIFSGNVMKHLMVLARAYLERSHELELGGDSLRILMTETLIGMGMALFLPLLFIVAAAILSNYLQVGFLFSTKVLMPDLNRLNPISGLKRIFSMASRVEVIKNILKLSFLSIIALFVLMPLFSTIDPLTQMSVYDGLKILLTDLLKIMIFILSILCVIAGLDYLYQRYDYMKKMKMTRQEVKDENKQTEGDPLVKRRFRKYRIEKMRKRMMQSVPTATVVVTNPTHYAVALLYETGMNAPILVAKGVDFLALRIKDLARENNVPILENPPLARTLYNLVEIDDEIMPEHYKAVAEIISYVIKLRQKVNAGRTPVGMRERDDRPANAPTPVTSATN